jgi:hypothetical protein
LILVARDAFAGGFAFRFRLSAMYLRLTVVRLAHGSPSTFKVALGKTQKG